MTKRNSLSFFTFQGNYEIMKSLFTSQKPLQFKDLKNLKNPKTEKKYSTRTIAESLKLLEEKDLIRNEITTNNKRRKYLGYSLTDKGKGAIQILKETEEKLDNY